MCPSRSRERTIACSRDKAERAVALHVAIRAITGLMQLQRIGETLTYCSGLLLNSEGKKIKTAWLAAASIGV